MSYLLIIYKNCIPFQKTTRIGINRNDWMLFQKSSIYEQEGILSWVPWKIFLLLNAGVLLSY